MASKVKIKCEFFSQDQRVKILRIFDNFNIKCSKLVSSQNVPNECVAILHSITDVDKVFVEDCLSAFETLNCIPVMPPQLKAKRSIIMKSVDRYIYEFSENEILYEINRVNATLKAITVSKFSNARIIKITLSNQEMTGSCLQNGIKLFNLHINPRDLHQEVHHDIRMCFRCYELDSHLSFECPKEQDFKICSNCSCLGHTFKSCSSQVKKCINCGLNHSTISYSCQKRKDVIKRMNIPIAVKKTLTSTVIKGTSVGDSTDICDSLVKSMLCLIVAKAKDEENPGSFDSILSSLQEKNNVPKFQLGDISMPKNISKKVLDELNVNAPNSLPITVPQNSVIQDSTENSASTSTLYNAHTSISTNVDVSEASSTETLTPNSVPVDVPLNNVPKISIFKKKTAPAVSSRNMESLFNKGDILIECNNEFTPQECLSYLKNNLLLCKKVLLDVKTKYFRSKN